MNESGASLVVYNTDDTTDKTFTVNGIATVFSGKKQNRLLFTDDSLADALLELDSTFVKFAHYGGKRPVKDRLGTIDDVAAVIVSHRTPELTRNAYESFRRVYPNIRMYVIDNGSAGANTEYVKSIHDGGKTISVLNPYNYGHGPAMHQAAAMIAEDGYRFMFALDSDTVTEYGGFVEAMLGKLGSGFAIGKRYFTCEHGFVSNSERGVPYVHPNAALYNLKLYRLLRPFALHGAPCIHSMIDARLRWMDILDFPIDEYVHHYGTKTVTTIAITDVNAAYLFPQRPPLVSFVVHYKDAEQLKFCLSLLSLQTDSDYEIVPLMKSDKLAYRQENISLRVRGLYMVVLDESDRVTDYSLVATIRQIASDNLHPDMIIVKSVDESGNKLPSSEAWRNTPIEGGVIAQNLIARRELWMSTAICLGGNWDEFATVQDLFSRDDWVDFYWLDKVVVHVGR